MKRRPLRPCPPALLPHHQVDALDPRLASAEFVAETERDLPVSLLVYTKDALLFLRCASPDERAAWAAALGDAARELYAPDELEAKREAERALLPLLLRQNALQFQRRNLLRANLAVAGKVTAARVRRVKQGYLRFERAKYVAQRSERAAAMDLPPDAEPIPSEEVSEIILEEFGATAPAVSDAAASAAAELAPHEAAELERHRRLCARLLGGGDGDGDRDGDGCDGASSGASARPPS